MSDRCLRCFKPQSVCLCKYSKNIDTGIKFVFLMHPKEFKKQRTGTGYLSHLCLEDSEIIVGLDFDENSRLKQLLNDSSLAPFLLYPGEDSLTVKDETFLKNVIPEQNCENQNNSTQNIQSSKKIVVLILDATWFCSKKMIDHNPFLLELPKLSFFGNYTSIFTFKREPKPEYISTIESCYYLIKELQSVNLINKNIDPEPLMTVFKEMIKIQITAENERILGIRPDTHHYDGKYKKLKQVPDFLKK